MPPYTLRASLLELAEPTYLCPYYQCGQKFYRQSGLNQHRRTHRRAMSSKIKCPHINCSYSSFRQKPVDDHILSNHFGVNPYSCTDDINCNFSAATPGALTIHRKREHNYVPGVFQAKDYRQGTEESSSSKAPPSVDEGADTPALQPTSRPPLASPPEHQVMQPTPQRVTPVAPYPPPIRACEGPRFKACFPE